MCVFVYIRVVSVLMYVRICVHVFVNGCVYIMPVTFLDSPGQMSAERPICKCRMDLSAASSQVDSGEPYLARALQK